MVRSICYTKQFKLIVTGYKTFYAHQKDFDLGQAPKSWALLPAIRKAMTKYPHTTYFWALSPHAVIMNPTQSLVERVMAPKKLESLMIKDQPVVPPDSVIHTFSHLKGHQIDFVITQDAEGLCSESMILRRGDWANFFLDVWFDPLYRSYNFQKAENHALVRSPANIAFLLTTKRNTLFNGIQPF